jgi:cholesterol transport system auxiliary component
MKNRATYTEYIRDRGLIAFIFLALSGCALPRLANTPVVYDFGPGQLQAQPSSRLANLPPLELGGIKASAALSGMAVLYRLTYADAQQLKPYTLARWSMPPAELIEQSLRAQLGQRRAVLSVGSITLTRPARLTASAPVAPLSTQPQSMLGLHLELEEFSQLFETPDKSNGVLRLRATVTQRTAAGEALLAQRSFTAQSAATTPDAAGGVRALAGAVDQVVKELEGWVRQVELAHKTPKQD